MLSLIKTPVRWSLLFASFLLLSACQAQNTQPQPVVPSAPQPTADTEALEQELSRLLKSSEQVEQRITLMQEQMIKLNEQMEVSQQRSLQVMQALQQVHMTQTQQLQQGQEATTDNLEQPAPVTDSELQALDIRLQQLEQSPASKQQMGFQLVSAYTPKGQWIIFKYDEATGLTWKAQDGGWIEIKEVQVLPPSRYQVVLRPAAGDVKGYVAARVDSETGQSWWLKGNSWEPFQ